MMLFLHDASLYLLYVALGLAVFLAIERTIFYSHASGQIKSLMLMALEVGTQCHASEAWCTNVVGRV